MVWLYSCPRCGEYYISELLYKHNSSNFKEGNFPLACVAFEWRLRHKDTPDTQFVLTDEGQLPYSPYVAFPECRVFLIDEMNDMFPKGADIIQRAMLNLSEMVNHPVDLIPVDRDRMPYALFTKQRDMDRMLDELAGMKYVRYGTEGAGGTGVLITANGWEQITKWKHTDRSVSKKAFVAMWFSPRTDKIYSEGIEPAIKSAGFDPMIIRNKEHNNDICDEIVAEIRKSRFIVADFTGGSSCEKCESCDKNKDCKDKVRPRGGVYFEAGFALGLGIPVIWTVRKDQLGQVHFDTRQYNYIPYETSAELQKTLYNRIVATIR